MQKIIAVFLCLAAVGVMDETASAAITVMTQNLYIGAAPDSVITAIAGGNPGAIFSAGTAFYNKVLATNYPARAAAIAAEIDQARPALIGLQEAALYRTGPAGDSAAATHVEVDFVATLIGALNARGLHYAVAEIGSTSDVESTTSIDNGVHPIDLRLTDRNAILYNTDLTPTQLTLSNPQSGIFANHQTIPTASSGSIELYNGWNSVDVVADGQAFRFINAHLTTTGNGVTNEFQWGQASELISGPGNTALPQVYVGDYNSRASGVPQFTYNNMVGAGLHDIWNEIHPGVDGWTWGQQENLMNVNSTATKRIDLVMTRGGIHGTAADVVGDNPGDKTPSGLWPSDHAGLVATLVMDSAAVPEPGSLTIWCIIIGLSTLVWRRAHRAL